MNWARGKSVCKSEAASTAISTVLPKQQAAMGMWKPTSSEMKNDYSSEKQMLVGLTAGQDFPSWFLHKQRQDQHLYCSKHAATQGVCYS